MSIDTTGHFPHTQGGPDFLTTCAADGQPWPCETIVEAADEAVQAEPAPDGSQPADPAGDAAPDGTSFPAGDPQPAQDAPGQAPTADPATGTATTP